MKKTLYKALALGAVAGMRSMAAPAFLSRALQNHKSTALSGTPLKYLHRNNVAVALTAMAASELFVDKLPGLPDRIELPSLFTRAASGAVVGAAVYAGKHKSIAEGAMVGAAAAVLSTYASFYLRKSLHDNSTLPDPLIGFLEDVLVVGGGLKAAGA